MTDVEIHDWALGRFGSEHLACKLAIVRQMHADVQLAEHHRILADDESVRTR